MAVFTFGSESGQIPSGKGHVTQNPEGNGPQAGGLPRGFPVIRVSPLQIDVLTHNPHLHLIFHRVRISIVFPKDFENQNIKWIQESEVATVGK